MATVWIPTPLRKLTDRAEKVSASGSTVAQIIDDLDRQHNGLKEKLCEDNGTVKRFVNIYVNNRDIRFMQQLDTAVMDDDEISIMPAIAGGILQDTMIKKARL